MYKHNKTNPAPSANPNSSLWQQLGTVDGFWFTGIFTLVSFILCGSLFLQPNGHLHSLPVGDKGTNLWNLWWVYYALFERHVSPLWCDLIYYPWGGDLRFHTLSIMNGIIAAPVTAIFGAVAAYNTLFFLWTILTGVFGALWAQQFGLSRLCAFAIGFMAAFHPFRWNHIEHLNLFSTAWLFASFYFCETWIKHPSKKTYGMLIFCWTLAVFSNWYFGLFVGIYFGIRLFLEYKTVIENRSILAVLIYFLIPMVWFGSLLYGYFQPHHAHPPFPAVPDRVDMIYSAYWSMTVFHYFTPIWMLHLLPPPNNSGAEFRIHPGLLQLGIIIAGLFYWKIVPITKQAKRFISILIITFGVISLGPFLQILGLPVSINNMPVPIPGVVFEFIQGLTSMRVYARFAYIAWLGLGIIGMLWLQEKIFSKKTQSTQLIITAVILSIFLIETGWKPLTMHTYDPENSLRQKNFTGPVLEIPFEPTSLSGTHLYHQTIHQQPIYAVEFSRIPSYRNAYLDTHPFLKQINAFSTAMRLSEEEKQKWLDEFCINTTQLNIHHIEIGKVPPSSILLDRPNTILNQFSDCKHNLK